MKFSQLVDQLKLYWQFAKRYKISIVFLILSAIIIEIGNLGEKYLYKFFIDDATQYLPDQVQTFFSSIIITISIFIIILIIRAILTWVRMHIQNKFIVKLKQDVKTTFYSHVLNLSYDFHTTHKSGMLISRITRGERACESISESLFQSTLPLLLQIVFVLFAVGSLHIYFTIIILLGIITLIGSNFYLQNLQLQARKHANDAEDTENAHISDTFTNIETIKYFGKESYMDSNYKKTTDNTRKKVLIWEQYFRYFQTFNDTLPGFIIVILLCASAFLLADNAITIGDIVFVQATFMGMIGPMRFFMWMFRQLYTGLSDMHTLSEYLEVKPEIVDTSSKKLVVKKGSIEFNDLTFSYKKEKVFSQFNLSINQGEKVALVGHSGSGKSTLVKLLYRLYETKKGSILIDGQPIKDVTQSSLRQSLSIVPQEGILFDDTLYNNVKFVNQNATRTQIMQAFKDAQLSSLLKRLEKKENTIVGERGVRLSGGERQRVAIARALIANTKILVLDEATSALDSQTEKQIQLALKRLLKDKTAIIIAHRLSTIMNADKIVVLEQGTITEMGKHEELLNKKGAYYDLWNLQKGGYIE